MLRKEFVFNNARADSRKGGLIAMAAVALALSQVSSERERPAPTQPTVAGENLCIR